MFGIGVTLFQRSFDRPISESEKPQRQCQISMNDLLRLLGLTEKDKRPVMIQEQR